jgi:hypothetical protein
LYTHAPAHGVALIFEREEKKVLREHVAIVRNLFCDKSEMMLLFEGDEAPELLIDVPGRN